MPAYATIQDMIDRFTQTEILRLSATTNVLPVAIEAVTVNRALDDATALVESYLRKRYFVPVDATADIIRATCILARYDLATGGDKEPTTQMKEDRASTIKWLEGIASGMVSLDGATPASSGGKARMSDRPRVFTPDSMAGQ
jgi:phage gp36-like protein